MIKPPQQFIPAVTSRLMTTAPPLTTTTTAASTDMQSVASIYWWLLMILPIVTMLFYPLIFDGIWKRYSPKYQGLTDDRQSKVQIKTLRALYFFIAFSVGMVGVVLKWDKCISFDYFRVEGTADIILKTSIAFIIAAYLTEILYRFRALKWYEMMHHSTTIILGSLVFNYEFPFIMPRFEVTVIGMVQAATWFINISGIYYYLGPQTHIKTKAVLYGLNAAWYLLEFFGCFIYYIYMTVTLHSQSPERIIGFIALEIGLAPAQIFSVMSYIDIIRFKILLSEPNEPNDNDIASEEVEFLPIYH